MTRTRDTAPQTGPNRPGHETRDIAIRPIVIFLAGVFAMLTAILLLMGLLFHTFATREARRDVPPSPLATRRPPPEPRLQVDPARELAAMRAAEDALLHSTDWVDRGAGIVRIPIDRAITLLAQRGLPARPQQRGDK
ncbi:MAG: hypothetical protein ACREJA_02105 [Candidatus Methylomirabilales bacterium]